MREASIERITSETSVAVKINLDGTGTYDVNTGVPFMDHMLSLFSRHSFIDLTIAAKGDTQIDYHHTVEDIGIVLGTAVKNAIGDKKGMVRYGSAYIPLNESLSRVVLDLCNRTYLVYDVKIEPSKVGDFDTELVEDFFHGFADAAGATIHITNIYGKNSHHIIETIFKAFGVALGEAVSLDTRIRGVRSTKDAL